MRILHVYKDYYPVLGGIEGHLRMVARAQVERGLEVAVLVTNPQGLSTTVERDQGVEVIRAGRLATIASTPISLALPWQLLKQKPDIVHLHFPYPLAESSQWLLQRGQATVITYHSDVIRQESMLKVYKPVLQRVLQQADRILPTSPNYIQSSPYLRPLADKCTVVPLGIDVTHFGQDRTQEVAAIRRRYPGTLLLFVGRLRYYKGLHYLVEAMKQVETPLLIVGRGPQAEALETQARQNPNGDNIHFLGDISDEELPAYFQAADIFVLPSSQRSEAFGIVLLEAMAARTALISTELQTGTSWVNQHGTTGLVVPAQDADALAEAINTLLQDEPLRKVMADNAHQRVTANFDLPVLIDRILDVYASVLA